MDIVCFWVTTSLASYLHHLGGMEYIYVAVQSQLGKFLLCLPVRTLGRILRRCTEMHRYILSVWVKDYTSF